jgi:hypothetical protein
VLRVSLRNVLANKLRLLLTIAAVTVGVAFVSGTFVLSDTMSRAFDQLISSNGPSWCSRIVRTSASIWVGCHWVVSPLNTGTPAESASCSTVAWSKPRNSMPSNIRPSTRAVSEMDSAVPMCEPSGPR